MALVDVPCPACQRIDGVQEGKQAHGTQRSRGHKRDGPRTIVLLHSQEKGRLPAVRQPIVAMPLHGSGVQDIVRVLGVRAATGSDGLKKKRPRSTRGMKDGSTRWLLRTLT